MDFGLTCFDVEFSSFWIGTKLQLFFQWSLFVSQASIADWLVVVLRLLLKHMFSCWHVVDLYT